MKPEEKIILGLDPGFGRTGYAVLTGSKDAPRLIDYGLIETAADLKQAKRLALVVQRVEKVINLHHPHIVAVEKVFFAEPFFSDVQRLNYPQISHNIGRKILTFFHEMRDAPGDGCLSH